MSPAVKNEPSVGALLSSLAHDTGLLVRQEVQLATVEATAKTHRAARGVGVVIAGGAMVHAAAIMLALAAVWGLATMVPTWLSALIVGVVGVLSGYALVTRGLAIIKDIDPIPRHTEDTLKADIRWAKEQLP